MAKLKTLALELLGETYEFPLKCSTTGVFSTSYPPSVWSVVNTRDRSEFTTLAELETAIHAVVREVNAAATTTKNLIFIKTSYSQDASGNEGAALSMEFVAIHQKIRGKRIDSYEIEKRNLPGFMQDKHESPAPGYWIMDKYSDYTSHWKHDKIKLDSCKSIEFTPESYEFLAAMRDRIVEIGKKLEDILQPESILQLSGQAALPEFL